MSEHFTSILRVTQSGYESPGEEFQLCFSFDGKTVSLPQLYPAPPTSRTAMQFTFDNVYPPNEDEKTVYRNGVRTTVESTLLGYNGTVISLEVEGNESDRSTLQDAIGRASEQIFLCLKKSMSSRSAANLVVNCSFVAVADEKAYDLLVSFSNGTCDNAQGGVVPVQAEPPFTALSFCDDHPQASVHEAKSQSQVFALMQHGRGKEKKLLEQLQSQRCTEPLRGELPSGVRYHHTILSLTVEYSHFGTMNAPVSGTLSFVRLSSPHPLAHRDQYVVDGEVEQSVLSLLALARAVSALTREESSPEAGGDQLSLQSPSELGGELYSKSLLTQIMKDAVGGNCKTIFMCRIPESLPVSSLPVASAALQLVSRARHIRNKPNKRDLAERALMAAYMKQLRLQYDGAGGQEEEEEEQMSSSGTDGDVKEDERQHAMELAATALAQAVGSGGAEGDSESSEDEEYDGRFASLSHRNPLMMSVNLQVKKAKKCKETKGHGSDGMSAVSASGVTIDALVGVLQDPDRGVPRALETRLKDVKIRRDVGALFSGAGIVEWMLGNVEGVESESDAVTLGQLLLDEGAIFHSEGSMVFANADSLFYYAREARLGKRLLSPEEIQALLNCVREPETTVTSVPIKNGHEACGGQERDENLEARGTGDGKSLGSPTLEGEQQEMELLTTAAGSFNTLNSAQDVDQWSPEPTSSNDYTKLMIQSPVDQSGGSGGVGDERRGSQASVESWMLSRGAKNEEMNGQIGEGAEGEGAEGGGGAEGNGNPNTAPQQSIPSIHTLENSVDYPHPLHMAVAVGKHPGVIRNLVMMCGVDKTDEQERTPLMFAALGNKRSSCSTLIACGANVDTQDASGLTALHVACYHGAREATRVLLSKRASVTAADKMGHTALHWTTVPDNPACLQLLLHYLWPAVLKLVDSSGLTAMHWAIFYNHPHHLKLLVKKCSDVLEVDSSGRTLLTYAIERDPPNRDCINVLIECCPYLLTQKDANGRLPLHMASISPYPLPLSLLINNRPPKCAPLEVNCVDADMRTPLHYASAANNLENVQALLYVSADLHAVDIEGRTPLDYASQLEGGADTVALLQRAEEDASPTEPSTAVDPGRGSATNSEICTLL